MKTNSAKIISAFLLLFNFHQFAKSAENKPTNPKWVRKSVLDNFIKSPRYQVSNDGNLIMVVYPQSCIYKVWATETGEYLGQTKVGQDILTAKQDDPCHAYFTLDSMGIVTLQSYYFDFQFYKSNLEFWRIGAASAFANYSTEEENLFPHLIKYSATPSWGPQYLFSENGLEIMLFHFRSKGQQPEVLTFDRALRAPREMYSDDYTILSADILYPSSLVALTFNKVTPPPTQTLWQRLSGSPKIKPLETNGILITDYKTGKPLQEFQTSQLYNHIKFIKKDKDLYVYSIANNEINVWDAYTGNLLVNDRCSQVSAGGEYVSCLFADDRGRQVKIWKLENHTGQLSARSTLHHSWNVTAEGHISTSLSANGKYLAMLSKVFGDDLLNFEYKMEFLDVTSKQVVATEKFVTDYKMFGDLRSLPSDFSSHADFLLAIRKNKFDADIEKIWIWSGRSNI